MRIIVDGTQAGNRSGTGEYTLQLALWLPHIAPDLEITFAWPDDVVPPPNVPILRFRRRGPRGLQYLFNRSEWLKSADLVHYPASVGHPGSLARAVVTVHDVSYLVNPAWFRRRHALYYRAMISRSARKAAVIIADSEITASDLQERLGIQRERIRVIPLGVDVMFRPSPADDVERVCKQHGLPDKFLLFVGTQEPRKNLPRLVEAFAQIAHEIPHSLVLAGRSGWKCRALRRALARPELHERIITPGFIARENLPALLTAADGFVWPSLYEGFGLPPLEAMACGTPVLTSNTASLPEVVGDAALMVDPENSRDISAGIKRLVTDASLRDTLRQRGLKRVGAFTWQRTAELTADVYRQTLAGHAQP
ncbi:MAG: glycosyltransferase family 1 protein [Candidatus Hydrogenedentota bacterium]